jgi:hypothetical protein
MVVLMGTDRTSIHNPQYCLAGQGLRILSQEFDSIPMTRPAAYDLPITKLIFSGRMTTAEGESRNINGVFVYWFVSDTKVTATHGERMWQMGLNLIRTGVLERWAYIIAMAPCLPGGEDEAYERLRGFIQNAVPEYQLTTGGDRSVVTSAKAELER